MNNVQLIDFFLYGTFLASLVVNPSAFELLVERSTAFMVTPLADEVVYKLGCHAQALELHLYFSNASGTECGESRPTKFPDSYDKVDLE